MRFQRLISTAFFFVVAMLCQAQIQDLIRINPNEIEWDKTKGFDKMIWKSDYRMEEAGKPELPVIRVSYLLPLDAKFTGVTFSTREKQLLKDDVYISPVQLLTTADTGLTPIRLDSALYSSEAPYPGRLYDIESDDVYQGYHIVTVRIYPFEYIPKRRMLNYYSALDFVINYESNQSSNVTKQTETQGAIQSNLSERTMKAWVRNPSDAELFGYTIQNAGKSEKSMLRSTTTAGMMYGNIAPRYIILTRDSLKSAFQSLADWKTKKGAFSKIVTVEEITNSFSGNDLAESIRKYLMNAAGKWGNSIYVLLGGGVNVIPSRLVYGVYASDSNNDSLIYPTDKYYSTTSTWQYKKNNIFIGNDTKSVVNIVGRIPVNSEQEVFIYIEKLIAYEKGSNLGDLSYLKNNLYADAYMKKEGSLSNYFHSSLKSYVVNNVPSFINNKYICDNADCTGPTSLYTVSGSTCSSGEVNGDLELNRNNFLSALSSGGGLGLGKFHFVFHMDHCNPTVMGASNKDKGQNIYNSDMDNLDNGSSYQVMLSLGCHPANFTYDCIGKHYLLKQNGGGVAFISNTDIGYQYEYPQLNGFLQSIYRSGIYNIGNAFQYTLLNYSLYDRNWRLHLLGDPEMQIWTNTPQTMGVTLSTTSMPCGEGSVSVAVSGLQSASEEVRICLYKKNEVFESRTEVGNGTFTFSGIHPLTVGDLSVTVTAHNYFPVEKTISVTANPNQHVRYKSLSVDDDKSGSSNGNNDGKMDAGETIELALQLENNGQAQSGNVVASLSCSSPYITLISSQASFGDIPAGQTKTSLTKYAFRIDKDAPELLADDPNAISFFLNISDGNGNSFSNAFGIDVLAPSLKIGNRTIDGGNSIAAGQAVNFYIDLQNLGKGKARGVSATLSTTSSYVQSYTSSPHQYPDIAWGEANKNTLAFQLQTTANYPTNGALNLSLKVQDEFGKVWNLPFNLTERPGVVSGLSFTSVENNIKLTWASLSGISGYNIYRCAADQNRNESGSYVKLNKDVLAMPYYQDDNVSLVSKYYYKVSAVSPTGNEGTLSSPFPAWTSFGQKGLYPVRFDFYFLTWGTNPVDVNNDGYKEVFAVSRYGGHIVGLDHTGRELFDTDNNVTTYNGFAETGIPTDATPAIGDIYGDGKQYLVEPTRDLDHPSSNKLICYSMEDRNGDSKPDVKWEKPLVGKTYRGAILSNLDNSTDGSLEIVVGHETGDSIRIFDANGVQLRSKGGINMTYAAMAVADLDGDGQKEIIAPGYGGIYAWHRDFTPFGANECLYTINDPNYAFVSSVMVCDLDNDGQKEILTTAVKKTTPYDAKVYAIKLDGTLLSGWGLGAQAQRIPCEENWLSRDISVGDLNHDGNLEVVIAGTNVVKVLNKDGQLVAQMAVDNFQPHGCPVLADVDGDADAEIVVSSKSNECIHAFNMDGSKVMGFPLKLQQDPYHRGVVAVADIDNDGKNEVIVNAESSMYVFATEGKPENVEWGVERCNQWNTGEYTKPCQSLSITSNTVWSSDRSICGNLTIYPGSTLTVNNNCHIGMGGSSVITVRPGAALVVDAANLSDVSIKALPGSSLTIRNGSHVRLRPGGECSVDAGAVGDISYGAVDMP